MFAVRVTQGWALFKSDLRCPSKTHIASRQGRYLLIVKSERHGRDVGRRGGREGGKEAGKKGMKKIVPNALLY